MTARLQVPFPSLSADNFVSRGSAGQVFAVSQSIVFKCPTSFENPAFVQAEEMVESIEKMNREKAIHRILQEHRHPNIIHSVLCVPEGLFMQRLETTLEFRISQSKCCAIDDSIQSRWIQQITSGTAWLERLGYVHGDLRPANVLVDVGDDLRLTDFDATVRRGERLLVASEPFCKLDLDYELPIAGPQSEQFSLGSCFYNIRYGHIPFHDLDAPTRVRKLMQNEFPSTFHDTLFGDLIQACWQGVYMSIDTINMDILPQLLGSNAADDRTFEDMDRLQVLLLDECNKFLTRERQTSR
jgi:serine/threonine protein kinase